MTLFKRRIPADIVCIAILLALWYIFFWRFLTSNPANSLTFKEGDFSGQFVAWAVFQGQQQAAGHIPLWNPFNNGGHPFLADTQAAVFYPIRALILALTYNHPNVTAGEVYNALQLETLLHVLIASLLMYTLVRRMSGSRWRFVGGMAAGITFAYGGYLTGYPILEPATMGAVIWIPLMLLGILEATRHQRVNWVWFGVSGVALGLSLQSGYPQLTHWSMVLTGLYLCHRVYKDRRDIRVLLGGGLIYGVIGGGLAAIQLLPGLQFYVQSARKANFTFDTQGNGFPPYDVIQMLLPGWLTLWSPLFFGVTGVALVVLAVWRRVEGAWFWLGTALAALGLSFGRNTLFYDLFYNFIPGFSWFRQQERASFPIAVCASVLVGLGAINLLDNRDLPTRFAQAVRAMLGFMTFLVVVFFITWQISGTGDARLKLMTFSLFIGALTVALLWWLSRPLSTDWTAPVPEQTLRAAALIALITLDLFTIGHSIDNYDHGFAFNRMPTPVIVKTVQADTNGVYRVDGQRGVLENNASIYGVQDVRGISPLRLDRYEKLLGLPVQRLWELMAVRYVFTDNRELPIPSTIVDTGRDGFGPINLHRLNDPRPFARLVYRTWIEPDDQAALNALANPDIDVRHTAVLLAAPKIDLPANAPADAKTEVQSFAAEAVKIQTTSTTPALLDVSLVNYQGWEARIDGQPVDILRSNVALMAVPVPAGTHTVEFVYRSTLFSIGAAITLVTLLVCITGAVYAFLTRKRWQQS